MTTPEYLYWANIPGLPNHISDEHSETASYILTANPVPCFVYIMTNRMPRLEQLFHTLEEVEMLNNSSVHIYLYEPLCLKIRNTPYNQLFYSEFETPADIDLIEADELESIKLYVTNNHLTNVIVHTCDYNVDKYCTHYLPYMKLLYDDMFIKLYATYPVTEPRNTITKKFICCTWRYTVIRHVIAAYTARRSINLSWFFKGDYNYLTSNLWFDINQMPADIVNVIRAGAHYIDQHSPFCLDIPVKQAQQCANRWPTSKPYSPSNQNLSTHTSKLDLFYYDSFCDIVIESRFAQPTGNFSEKVLQAIKYKRPFILVAPPRTLQCIKEAGFKTFSDFWDESYDTCECHTTRLVKILELISHIDNISTSELITLRSTMMDILEHNYNILKIKL